MTLEEWLTGRGAVSWPSNRLVRIMGYFVRRPVWAAVAPVTIVTGATAAGSD